MAHTSSPLPSLVSVSIFARKRMAPVSPRLKRPTPKIATREKVSKTMSFFMQALYCGTNSAIATLFTVRQLPYAHALSRGADDRDVGEMRQHFVAKGIAPRLHHNQTVT